MKLKIEHHEDYVGIHVSSSGKISLDTTKWNIHPETTTALVHIFPKVKVEE